MFQDYDPDDLDVRVSELLVATSDASDVALDGSIREVLQLLRAKMNMDVVFVSEFTGGRRVFRQVAQGPDPCIAEGASDPLEESWCQHVVDGRLPGFIQDARPLQADGKVPKAAFPVGTHISAPVVLPDGEVYGTICSFSFAPVGASEADLKRLRYTAELAAKRLQARRDQLALEPVRRQPLT